MGKNNSNMFCESCGKFHKPGKHTPKVIDDAVKGNVDAILSIVGRATANLYLSRDMLGDADITNEDNKDGYRRDSKKDK